MVMEEAGGKDSGGEEEAGGGEEGVWRREWTAMEDMLLVYWCCTLPGGGRSEPVSTAASCGQTSYGVIHFCCMMGNVGPSETCLILITDQ